MTEHMRHYAAYIDTDSIVPSNTDMAARNLRKLRQDPSAVLVSSPMHAFGLYHAGMVVVRVRFDPRPSMGLSLDKVLPRRSDSGMYDLQVLEFPLPWGGSAKDIIVGCRACLPEDYRKNLHTYIDRPGLV